jgi:hypothetical protein
VNYHHLHESDEVYTVHFSLCLGVVTERDFSGRRFDISVAAEVRLSKLFVSVDGVLKISHLVAI